METAIQEYSPTAAALAELASRFKGAVYDMADPEEMDSARKARAEIREYRFNLEKMRVDIKAPALERCRLIDAEAKRITTALLELETPIDDQIKKEEGRKEAERQKAVLAEQERIEAEQRAIREREEAKMRAEREEIARRQAELDAAERARTEADRKARLGIEEQERASRARIEAEEREARKVRQAEEDRLRAEREALDRAKREQEEKERAERLAKERSENEARQKANELLDARGMLATFVERYGKIKEFAEVVKAIRAYQKQK